MLLEIHGACQHCHADFKLLMLNGEALTNCPACHEAPFAARQFKGIVYVVSNANQVGVKIGLTTKTMEARLKSLNSTGVPGDFEPIAIFPSDNPAGDERRVHDKLRRHWLAKEHFDLDPIDAVLGAWRALNKREPIFFDPDIEETFNLRVEQAKIEMRIRLKGARG